MSTDVQITHVNRVVLVAKRTYDHGSQYPWVTQTYEIHTSNGEVSKLTLFGESHEELVVEDLTDIDIIDE